MNSLVKITIILLIINWFDCKVTHLPDDDHYFVNETNYSLILPSYTNANNDLNMNIYSWCADDCKMTFLFQCNKYSYDNETRKLLNIYDLALFRQDLNKSESKIVSLQLSSFKRCIKTDDLNQKFNQLAIEIHVQFLHNLNVINFNTFKHRFDLILSSFAFVKILTSLPAYKHGQTVKFVVVPFNRNLEEFDQIIQIKLLSPNKQLVKQWYLNYFANDQLNQLEYKLNRSHLTGLYTIEANVLNQQFRKSFFVVKYEHSPIELRVDFKDYHLIDDEMLKGSLNIKNLENIQNYYIRCSIFLIFKDSVEKQEVQIDLTKFVIKELKEKNVLELELNYLFNSIDRSRLAKFLNPKYDLKSMAHLKIQADLYLKNEDDNCNNFLVQRIEQRSFKKIKLLPKSKYIYCPSELQSNNSLPNFTITITCWIISLVDNRLDDLVNQNDRLNELETKTNFDELVYVHSWVRTDLNRIISFKTIKLRTFSNLIRFDLNLLDKFSVDDLVRFRSLELELRLLNDFRENIKINFKSIRSYAKSPEFRLRLNRLEVEVNELITIHIDSSSNRLIENVFLIFISNGQLLDVEIINSKSKQIKIEDRMFPSLTLIAYTSINGKLMSSRVTIKVKKKPKQQSSNSTHQLFTSFKQIENSTNLKIKLLSTSDLFIHLTSVKKDLDLLQKNLDTILINNNDQQDHCFVDWLADDRFDRCIYHFKFNEQNEIISKQINHQSLTSAIDSLFFNSSNNRKPFYFDIHFFNENLTRFFEFVQLRSLKEDDFKDNLVYLNTQLLYNFRTSNLGATNGNKSRAYNQTYYERTYEFRAKDKEPTIYFLDLYELVHKRFEVKRLVLYSKLANQNEFLKEKLIKSTGVLKCHCTFILLAAFIIKHLVIRTIGL